ncbi:hypothetical protein SO802_018340 [Lithocarpus litseifolius]|uniref:Zinc knuckle CX2CX4HX4C domain-containing protein n=1 Tax=Lithocarpus litseifolius TaxID=425828 RepID=A0AAW2CMF6_9ROSI
MGAILATKFFTRRNVNVEAVAKTFCLLRRTRENFELLTVEAALSIGETIGSVSCPKDFGEMKGGNFMRVRVEVDITKPLCRGRKISWDLSGEGWAAFLYEQLPNICYWCWLVSHDDKECTLWLNSRGSLRTEDQQFGPWIKDPQFNHIRKSVVEHGIGGRVHEENVRESRKHIPDFEETLNDIDDAIRNGPRIPNSKVATIGITANQIDSSFNLIDIEVSKSNAMIIGAEFNMGWDDTGLKGVKNKNRPNKCGNKGKQQIRPIIGPEGIRSGESNKVAAGLSEGTWERRVTRSPCTNEDPPLGVEIGLKRKLKGFNKDVVDVKTHEKEEEALEKAVKKEEPNIVFLMETKSNRKWMEKVKERCKLKLGLIVPSDGSKGGPAMLWKEGPKYTWWYQRSDGTQIWERLDRALANKEGIDFFPAAKLHHLSSSASNHSPLSLHLVPKMRKKKMKKTFRFESMWLKDSRCEDIVKAAWEEGLHAGTEDVLKSCLEHCRHDLDAWNKEEFGHVGRKIDVLQNKLEWLEL